jgi:PAS domain S-box-containing protein
MGDLEEPGDPRPPRVPAAEPTPRRALGPSSHHPLLVGSLLARTARSRDSELGLLDELTPIAQLVLDPSQHIVRANPAAHRILGERSGGLLGRSLSEVLDPGSRGALARGFEAANAPDSVSPPIRVEARTRAGSVVPVEAVIGRFPERGGAGYGVVLRDLQEQEALIAALTERGAELARSNRDLQEFTYIASHDLQEPLRMVGSYTQLVGERYRGRLDPAADEFLAFAQEGATRMQTLLDDLVVYARVDTRGQPFGPVSMDRCLSDALRNLRLLVEESGGEVERGTLPEVEGDAAQMTQLFQNLVANSLKFHGPDPPRVVVRGEDEGRTVLFSVRDNGIGIPPQYREKVFVIFQRLHRREEYPGTGIGLAVAKKVVERHGGTIWVTAGDPGGSVFSFRLPKLHGPTGPEAGRAPETPARPGARRRANDLIRERLKDLV